MFQIGLHLSLYQICQITICFRFITLNKADINLDYNNSIDKKKINDKYNQNIYCIHSRYSDNSFMVCCETHLRNKFNLKKDYLSGLIKFTLKTIDFELCKEIKQLFTNKSITASKLDSKLGEYIYNNDNKVILV